MSNNLKAQDGGLIVVSAPSGGGKTTIIKRILQIRPALKFSVSATTRPRKPGERESIDYHFLPRDEFQEMVDRGDLIEYENVHGEFYGTPKRPVDDALRKGAVMLFDLDVKGALRLKSIYSRAILIFIDVPSMETLRERLVKRHRESVEEIDMRLSRAKKEINKAEHFDCRIVNNDLDKAVAEIIKIIDMVMF